MPSPAATPLRRGYSLLPSLPFYPLFFTVSLFFPSFQSPAQSTLYDDTRVSSIYIILPADSLEILYDSVLSDHYYLARFVFDDLQHRDTVENIGFRLRGNTSRYAQKKSFKVSFNTYVPGRTYQGVKKLNLNGEHNDPTMVREKLFYELWGKWGMVPRRTSFVRVYVNGTYYGLYTNVEELDKEWLGRNYSNHSGNLFKCSSPADLAYHGTSQQPYKDLQNFTATGGRVYDLQTNEQADDYSGLVALIIALTKPADGNFEASLSAVFELEHYLKALALDVATGNWDDYSYNKNNYFLYQNPANGKFDMITYDTDNTFGIDWVGVDWGVRDCMHWINSGINLPLASKVMAVPALRERYARYLDTLVHTLVHPDTVFPRIDAMKALIWQAAADDHYRSLDFGYTLADFDNAFIERIDWHAAYGLKPFFVNRRQKILQQLPPTALPDPVSGPVAATLSPNPACDRVMLKLPAGDDQPRTVQILDMQGSTVAVCPFDAASPYISVGGLKDGLYFLEVPSRGTLLHLRLLKLTQ